MRKHKLNIWGREYEIPVLYECYDGQDVESSQQVAAQAFLSHPDVLQDVGEVRAYILEHDRDSVDDNVDNIFRYVIPTSLFVTRTGKENDCLVALLCNYKFDPEHGLAVLYKNGEIYKIGQQDIVL